MIMQAKYQCSIINTSEDMSQVKVFVTDGQTDRGMSFNVPSFRKRRGTTKGFCYDLTCSSAGLVSAGGSSGGLSTFSVIPPISISHMGV